MQGLAGQGAGSSHGCMGADDTKPGLPTPLEANMNCGGSVIICCYGDKFSTKDFVVEGIAQMTDVLDSTMRGVG